MQGPKAHTAHWMAMKAPRILVSLALAASVTLTLAGCTGKNAVNQTSGNQFRFVSANKLGQTWQPAERKKVGDFTAQLLDGNGSLTLSDDAGHVTVVNFWASWCAPCQVETPQFDNVYRAYKSKGVDFIGIDFKDRRAQAQSFITHNNISYPIVYDQQGKIAVQMGKLPALGLPFTVVIDKQQRVAAVYIEAVSPKDLEPVLNKLIAEPAPSASASAGN